MQRRSRTFRVFVSSTFSDLVEERNALQDRVFPKLNDYCNRHGCQFQAIDLRWGVSEEAGLDQQAMNICLEELRRCQRVSPRPNFIVLLGNRYGWQPLPPQIEQCEFDQLMKTLDAKKQASLKFDETNQDLSQGEGNGWYRLDRNAFDPARPESEGEYVLLPREKESPYESYDAWEPVERELLESLREAADKVFPDPEAGERKKYFQSATHQEIEAGALSQRLEDPGKHVTAWFRTFDRKSLEEPGDEKRAAFVDLEPMPEGADPTKWARTAPLDEEAWSRQQALRTDLISRLPGENVQTETVTWPVPEEGQQIRKHSASRRMCAFFLRRLYRVIRNEIASLAKESPGEESIAERKRRFTKRTKELRRLLSTCTGTDERSRKKYWSLYSQILYREIKGAINESAGQESRLHQKFTEEKIRHFKGRKLELNKILAYTGIDEHLGWWRIVPDRQAERGVTYTYVPGSHKEPSQLPPLFVIGKSGTGKTALLMKAWQQLVRATDLKMKKSMWRQYTENVLLEPTHVIGRIVGATPESTSIRGLLVGIGRELEAACGAKEESPAPAGTNGLITWFHRRLKQASKSKLKFVIFLDALDQLQDNYNARHLPWLPTRLPPGVRIVASVLRREGDDAGKCAENVRDRFGDENVVEVGNLPIKEGLDYISEWLADRGRRITCEQLRVLKASAAREIEPIWLRFVLEEARFWHSWEPVARLPRKPVEVIGKYLDYLTGRRHHPPLLVESSLSVLAASRHGLSEVELMGILAFDDVFWSEFLKNAYHTFPLPEACRDVQLPPERRRLPIAIWSRFHQDLLGFIVEFYQDHSALLGFYHRLFREAVERRWLNKESRRSANHLLLARWFGMQPLWFQTQRGAANRVANHRKLSEAPWQAIQAECDEGRFLLIGDDIQSGWLCDLRFLEAKCSANLSEDLSGDYERVMAKLPNLRHKLEREEAVIQQRADQARAPAEDASRVRFEDSLSAPQLEPMDREPLCDLTRQTTRIFHYRNFWRRFRSEIQRMPLAIYSIAAAIDPENPVASSAQRTMKETSNAYWFQSYPTYPSDSLSPFCTAVWALNDGTSDDFSNRFSNPERSLPTIGKFHVSSDLSRLLFVHRDKLYIWDLRSGALRKRIDKPENWIRIFNEPTIEASASDTDLGRVLILRSDGQLFLVDSKTEEWRRITEKTTRKRSCSPCLTVSRDFARAIVVRSLGDPFELWDIDSAVRLHEFAASNDMTDSLAANSDASCFLSAGTGGLFLHESSNRERITFTTSNVAGVTADDSFSRALGRIESENCLTLWDLATHETLGKIENFHRTRIQCSRDLKYCLAWDPNGEEIEWWDLASAKRLLVWKAHEGSVCNVVVSPDLSRAVSIGDDLLVKTWDLRNPPNSGPYSPKPEVSFLKTNSARREILAGDCGNKLFRWHLEDADFIEDEFWDLGNVTILSASDDLSRIAFREERNPHQLSVANLRTGQTRVLTGESDIPIRGAVGNNSLQRIVTAGSHYDMTLWDLEREIGLKNNHFSVSVRKYGEIVMASSPDFSQFLTVEMSQIARFQFSADEVNICDTRTTIKAIGCNDHLTKALIASGLFSGSILSLWDLPAAKREKTVGSHPDVRFLKVSPEAEFALSGGGRSIRLWDIEKGECLAALSTESDVTALDGSFTTGHFAYGCKNGEIRWLDLMKGSRPLTVSRECRLPEFPATCNPVVVLLRQSKLDQAKEVLEAEWSRFGAGFDLAALDSQLNYIVALLLQQDMKAAWRCLRQIRNYDIQDPRVVSFKDTIRSWEKSFSLLQRLGLKPRPPLVLPPDLIGFEREGQDPIQLTVQKVVPLEPVS